MARRRDRDDAVQVIRTVYARFTHRIEIDPGPCACRDIECRAQARVHNCAVEWVSCESWGGVAESGS